MRHQAIGLMAVLLPLALAIASGADIVRVHEVREMARVAKVADAIVRGWEPAHQGSQSERVRRAVERET